MPRGIFLRNFDSIFCPCKSREGVCSFGGAFHWLKCIKTFTRFVAPSSEDATLFSALVLIPARDLFLWMIKNFKGWRVPIEEARRQVEAASA